jgi:mannose-6-phosphate isomerase-like protein (cupin superfamily)
LPLVPYWRGTSPNQTLTCRPQLNCLQARKACLQTTDGVTIGIAAMTQNSPHGGEMHPDGDEVLYLISGRVNVVFEDETIMDVEMLPGDGLIVPQGVWHRVDILEPSQIMYATPGPGGEYRPL